MCKYKPSLMKIEVAFFTRYSLLVTRYSLVFTHYSLLFYSLLFAFLLVTRWILLITRCVFARYSLRFYSFLVTRCLKWPKWSECRVLSPGSECGEPSQC